MTPPQKQAAGSPGPADLVLSNGRIYTLDPKLPWAGAVAIRGEWNVAVASQILALESQIGPGTRVLDLHGQFAMPGFNDAHVHLAWAGYQRLGVNFDVASSLADFLNCIRASLKSAKPGSWVIGRGWDHTLWPEKRFPTREDLDALSTGHPMIFTRVDGHVAVANSRALALASITRSTPDPPGGRIVRDPATGEPTGVLEEDAAMNLVYFKIPPHSSAERRHAFELAMDEAVRYGVTSVQDNSVQNVPDSDNFGFENWNILSSMHREGALKVRVTEWLPLEYPLDRLEEIRREFSTTDPWFKVGALKAYLDGSIGSRTAAMLSPYSDDASESGILRVDPKKLRAMSIERDAAGFQLAFHAIGDRANRVALDMFAAVRAANGPRDRRDRIEHAQIVATEDLARFASLDVIASMQPVHLLDDIRWADARLGPARLRGAYAWRTMERLSVHLAFGTDYPVESINPLRGIYACVTRELPAGGPSGGWQPQEKLPIEDCLRDYTVESAYAEFEDSRKGRIAPGMLADIVVLPADLTRLAPRDLLRTPVSMTITGGRIVFESH